MKRVKVIYQYHDLALKKTLKIGDEVEMTDDRAEALSTNNNAIGLPLVQILATTPPTTEKVAKAKSKPRKKDE